MMLSLIVILSLIAAACGGSDEEVETSEEPAATSAPAADEPADDAMDEEAMADDVPPGVAEAQALVEAAMAPVTFSAPAGVSELDLAALEGKKVAIINLVEAVPILTQWQDEMTAAFEGSGVELTYFDGNFDPNEWGNGIQRAITDKADVIFLLGVSRRKRLRPRSATQKQPGFPC